MNCIACAGIAGNVDYIAINTDIQALQAEAQRLREKYNARISLLGAPELDISSRELRGRIAAGQSIRFMVPEKVRNYIYYYHLYGS